MRKTAFPVLFLAILATLGLLCATVGGRVTPQGVQCPTASVQTVTVAVRDCCDRVVAYETRAPKQGEEAFVQCRCAEKKAGSHEATLSAKVDLFLASREPDPACERPTAPFVRHLFSAELTPGESALLVRPPATA